jgi:hypothetical protein
VELGRPLAGVPTALDAEQGLALLGELAGSADAAAAP